MSDSREILKTKFIEHFLFDYTDKDEYEVRMLSEIFEGIYYQKDKHFKPESKYWQVFRCLADQQAIIDDLKAQLNNMEACYIEKKKQVEELQKTNISLEAGLRKNSKNKQKLLGKNIELQKRIDEALEDLEYPTAPWDETIASVVKALRGANAQSRKG